MDSEQVKPRILKKLHPRTYQIYGIFDFQAKNLIYVNLNYEDVELQFELGNYDDTFGIVEFEVVIH